MGGILAALATLAAPMTARVLMALGFSVVTITGVTFTMSTLKGYVTSYLGQGPIAAVQLVGLAGGWIGLGIIFGAMTWVVGFWTLTRAQRIIGNGGGA